MTSSRSALVVFARALDGRNDELGRWYDEVHLPEVVELDGFVAATRLEFGPARAGRPAPADQLVIYEVETAQLSEAKLALKRYRTERKTPVSEALAPGAESFWCALQEVRND